MSSQYSASEIITPVVTPALLFIVLAPGLILSIPTTTKVDTEANTIGTEKSLFFTGHVTFTNAAVHALVFVALLSLIQFVVLPMVLKK